MSADVTKADQASEAALAGPPVGGPAARVANRQGGLAGVLSGPAGRSAGLVVALVLLVVVGIVTAGDRFASPDNALTILRLGATIGVVSVGMTFVISGGGIDLSVGAIVALSSVWATTVATQTMAESDPAAPIRWPTIDFGELTGTESVASPRTERIAFDSELSLARVPVPWAQT